MCAGEGAGRECGEVSLSGVSGARCRRRGAAGDCMEGQVHGDSGG